MVIKIVRETVEIPVTNNGIVVTVKTMSQRIEITGNISTSFNCMLRIIPVVFENLKLTKSVSIR